MFTFLPALLHELDAHYERSVSLPSPSILIGEPDDGWINKPSLPVPGEIVDGESFNGEPRRGIYMDHRNGFWFVSNNEFAGCIARWRRLKGEMVEIRDNVIRN